MCVHVFVCMCVCVCVCVHLRVSVHVCIGKERDLVLLVPVKMGATAALGRDAFSNVFCQCQTKRAHGCWYELHNSMACCCIWDALSDEIHLRRI